MDRRNTMDGRKWLGCLLGCGAMALGGCVTEPDSVGREGVGSEVAAITKGCNPIHGQYSFDQTADGCPPEAAVCYEGELTGAGFLNGDVYLKILETGEVYHGESEITTNQGTLTMRHTGLFAPDDPAMPSMLFQADTSVVMEGTGKFLSATGHSWQTGFGIIAGPGVPVAGVFGEFHGELCLEH
jgi:hypothetical protein